LNDLLTLCELDGRDWFADLLLLRRSLFQGCSPRSLPDGRRGRRGQGWQGVNLVACTCVHSLRRGDLPFPVPAVTKPLANTNYVISTLALQLRQHVRRWSLLLLEQLLHTRNSVRVERHGGNALAATHLGTIFWVKFILLI
jgi:hypothetical protein